MTHDRHLALYRALSVLYPRSFRDAYREDLATLFSHQISDRFGELLAPVARG